MAYEIETKISNYFWEQIAPKMNIHQSDYCLARLGSNEYCVLFSDNGRLHVNSSTYHRIWRIPYYSYRFDLHLYAEFRPAFDEHIRLYYYENGRNVLYYQLWTRK